VLGEELVEEGILLRHIPVLKVARVVHGEQRAQAALPLCHADPALKLLGQFFERFGITCAKKGWGGGVVETNYLNRSIT
jgi:hypothetical protein